MQNLLKVIIMVNEHKAHASFVLRIINTFINCGLTLILAIILYAIFFPIDNNLVAGYVFCIIPTFSFIIWILFGMFYREIIYLSNHNKHKLLCESIRDITITIITNVLLTTGTSILYQLQNPIKITEICNAIYWDCYIWGIISWNTNNTLL